MFALGLLSWLYTRPDRPAPRRSSRASSARRPELLAGQPARVRGRLVLRRDHRGVRRPVRGGAGAGAGRAPTATSPATSRWPTGWSRPSHRAGLPLVLGSYPITPASDILHTLSAAQAVRRNDPPGRGRDRRHRHGARRGLRRGDRRHDDLRARARAEVRDDRPRRVARAAAGRRRRPARRPLDRPADQDRAGRPAAGDVRPQRRGPGADRRARAPPPTASTPRSRRCGSPPPTARRCCCSPTATSRTAPSRGGAGRRRRCRICRSSRLRRNAGRRGKPASGPTTRDPLTLARPWAVARRPGPRAPDRRHREGRRHRRDLLRPGQPRPHGPAAPGQDRRHRRCPTLEVDDPSGDAEVLVLGWGSTYGPIAAATRAVRETGSRSPRRTCATSTRSPRTPARCCAATDRVSCRR